MAERGASPHRVARWQTERRGGRAFEYIGAGTVSNVAPAATSQRNSCEMSRWYKHEQNSLGALFFSGGKTIQIFGDNSRDRLDEFSAFIPR